MLLPDGDSWREWDEDHFVAFVLHAQDAVAVFLAQIIDAGASGFEDPQVEHDDEGEVVRVR